MWYLQLGRRHILSSWQRIQYTLLTIYFSYGFKEIMRLVFEKFVLKLGITCNITTAAIWLLRPFLNNWFWKTRHFYYLLKPTKKGKRFSLWKCHVTMNEKGKNLLIWKSHVTSTKRDAFISHEKQLQNLSSIFIHKNKSLSSATSILSPSSMACNTTASLDNLTCTNYVDFGNCEERFGRFSLFENHSNYLEVKLKVFKKGENKKFRLVQNLTIGEADFNQFMRLRNHMVSKKLCKKRKFDPLLIPIMFKDMDDQIKLAHKIVDLVDTANRNICVTQLRYNVDKPECSSAQVQFFAGKKEDEKFQQVVYVIYNIEEFICLLDVMNSVHDKVINNQPICNVL